MFMTKQTDPKSTQSTAPDDLPNDSFFSADTTFAILIGVFVVAGITMTSQFQWFFHQQQVLYAAEIENARKSPANLTPFLSDMSVSLLAAAVLHLSEK